MNLAVLGATGRTGRLVIEQALAAGHNITALVRSPEKLATTTPNLRVVTGEATDAAALASALKGADAVINVLGGNGSVITDSTRAIVAAAHQTGVRRVVALSSFAVERERMTAVTRILTGLAIGAMIKDKIAGEHLLRQSDLDWTIVYASFLSDGRATGSVMVLPENGRWGLRQRISRADVAAWMLQVATEDQYSRQSVGVTSRHAGAR